MSRRRRPPYRPGLGWILGVAFGDTLTRPVRLAQGFTYVRCCGLPRASSPHGLTAPGPASHDGISLRAVASGSRLLPTRPAKDFHLQSSAHARHTSLTTGPSITSLRSILFMLDCTMTASGRTNRCPKKPGAGHLQHTVPDGFHRIRHIGFLASRHRTAKLALCRALL